MKHPFRGEFWTRRRTGALIVLLVIGVPPQLPDAAGAAGAAFGCVLFVWLGVVVWNAVGTGIRRARGAGAEG